MAKTSKAPKAHQDFIKRFPQLGEAWESMRAAEDAGPLGEKAARLVKLGVAIGAAREGAVHSAVRKAVGAGATRNEIEQVVALAASTIGMPACVAVYTWVQETLGR